ncbi:MAG: hypothetical protein JW806_00940 [Sedimentisphaerales bacterium]|nr:hypothetical protein [Sedimentisphaerales bacterium]
MLHFIITFVVFAGITAGVCTAFYGWGRLFCRAVRRPVNNQILTVVIGLGVVIFLGGILNLTRLAYDWVLDGLLIAGVILAFKFGKSGPKLPNNKDEWFYTALTGLLIIIIMGFTVKTQLKPGVFNAWDDLEKYFSHPVRMLQTGTLFGSPLGAPGGETLGGQAVLHAIVLNHFPIVYLNSVDAVFGLLLCLVLSVSIMPKRMIFAPIALLSILVIFFINPQYVNISTLYIGSAFVMASFLLIWHICEEGTDNLPSPVMLGLIYAALIAAKPIFAILPPLSVGFFVVTGRLYGLDFKRLVRWAVIAAVMTLLFVSPWILLHLPHYVRMSFEQSPQQAGMGQMEKLNLFSRAPLLYGASFAHYTFVSLAAGLAAIGFVLSKRKIKSGSERTVLAGLAAAGIVVIAVYLLLLYLGPVLSGYRTSVRFTIPFLIAIVPVILSAIYLLAYKEQPGKFRLSFIAIPVFVGICILISFSDTLRKRITQANKTGSILAFSQMASDPGYIKYNQEVISGDTQSRITAAQNHIPAGQAFVVWIYAPFYLDYKRNVIYDAEPAGLANPWAYMPDVDYFMVEYRGGAVRSINEFKKTAAYPLKRERQMAQSCLEFIQSLEQIREDADEIYNDGKIAVFKKRPD